MKKFCKYCQEKTEHKNDECLECESLSNTESESDYSEEEYDSDFVVEYSE